VQQRVHGIEVRRLDEHDDNGLAQSAHSGCRPAGNTDVPVVYNEPGDDHEGEDVTRN